MDFMEILLNFPGIFHGISRFPMEILWKFLEFSMDLMEILWNFLEFSMDFMEILWNFLEFSMDFMEILWIFPGIFNGISRFSIGFQ